MGVIVYVIYQPRTDWVAYDISANFLQVFFPADTMVIISLLKNPLSMVSCCY